MDYFQGRWMDRWIIEGGDRGGGGEGGGEGGGGEGGGGGVTRASGVTMEVEG